MTAKPYPHAAQKAARRGVLSAAGAKRVEVVLDAEKVEILRFIQKRDGKTASGVLSNLLFYEWLSAGDEMLLSFEREHEGKPIADKLG
jgi:hypothetical protein